MEITGRKVIIDNEYLRIEVQFARTEEGMMPFMHMEVFKWSHNLYKEYLVLVEQIWTMFRKNRVKKVFAAIPKNDTKALKHAMLYGFEIVYEDDRGQVLMERTI